MKDIGLKFRILEGEEFYYPCGENRDADQLCINCVFSHRQKPGFFMMRLINQLQLHLDSNYLDC